LEAHNQGPPFARIDTVGLTLHQQCFQDVDAPHANLENSNPPAHHFMVLSQAVRRSERGLKLNRTFANARRRDHFGGIGGEA
jgi:hypothetical protein